MRLLQLKDRTGRRGVGVVEDERVHLLSRVDSIHALAQQALAAHESLVDQAERLRGSDSLSYDDIYAGSSDWRIMPAIDHPHEPARCLLSGTGLTHLKSAQSRQAMHASGNAPSDSMRMYEWGIEGGRPAHGQIGTSPEWFYKGSGTMLRAHGEPLLIPPHAEDGGEEAEIAGIYIIDAAGSPRRLGMAIGNEFSDHAVEKKNYLYLAASKLMFCAIGPELVTDAQFDSLAGEVAIKRDGKLLWQREIHSGEKAMCHSLANIEYHHFKHPLHRRPGDVHVHFFGADAFSSGEDVKLKDGDVMRISFEGMGRALMNPVAVDANPQAHFCASPL